MIISLIVFLVGLVFGSFLNVLIYRLPLGISLLKPIGSACPHCNYKIKWYENIPVFSYLFLKGRCSSCSDSISKSYPIVELITAAVTLMLYSNFWIGWDMIITISLFYVLIVLSFIDLKYRAVPDYLLIIVVILAILVGDIINILLFTGGFVLLELAITFYIQNIKAKITQNKELENQRALGEGDMPIVGVIGGLLGVQLGITAIFLAAVLALLPAIYNLYSKKEIETAFIPFLSLGLLVTIFSGINLFTLFT
ncbi:prepilin peptidase [Candidatus Pseudothioglobus singularis]|jgi:leader peptidase (prepilin peptidase)/N-methyltransferase|uniref:Peptidase A24 n=1 Tax=Candidatus Pseudothioglobus singularis PS1 TaxID=1125411 RepID=A0A0M4LGC7_9GAMM|nr:A24 family peptidase [Candidatus Pseudothioglobus singularis]ALE01689.1 peptidase A24 [Candidatus Pseudothioglobus singularis PS1]